MRLTILILILATIILLPEVSGVMKTVDCFNNRTLRKYTNLTFCNATFDCLDYNLTEYVTCEYGCDEARMICTDFSGPPGNAVPFWLFVMFELIAFGLLAVSFVAEIPTYKLVSSLMALILLFSLGFMAVNIMTDQGAMRMDWLAWINIGLAWVGVIMFLASMLFVFREQTAKSLA